MQAEVNRLAGDQVERPDSSLPFIAAVEVEGRLSTAGPIGRRKGSDEGRESRQLRDGRLDSTHRLNARTGTFLGQG
jgi:hypothetical protein